MGELHGRPGACFHLAFHGFLILAKDVLPAARGQLTSVEIQQKIDLPGFKAIAGHLPAQKFADQASETIELEFALLVLICRDHSYLIGRTGAEL